MKQKPWQPRRQLVLASVKELKNLYLNGIPQEMIPFIEEFAKINVFLNDQEAVFQQLKKLNQLLLAENAKTNDDAMIDNYKRKLLRTVLQQELAKFDFAKIFAKAIGYLPPSIYRACISRGLLIKDPGAGLNHGEFTHALQWLLICWQQQESGFLKKPVISIFKQLGHPSAVYDVTSSGEERNLWDVLVDSLLQNGSANSPESLYTQLVSEEFSELSFLNALMSARLEKRMQKEGIEKLTKIGLFQQKKPSVNQAYVPTNESKFLLLPKASGN